MRVWDLLLWGEEGWCVVREAGVGRVCSPGASRTETPGAVEGLWVRKRWDPI